MKVAKRKKGIKEAFRKFIVSLKRRPHNIPLVFMLITFLVFALNMTAISNTTGYINRNPMGLCSFVIMLVSILAMVMFLRAFPKRKKPILWMVILLYVMMAIVAGADIWYLLKIQAWKDVTANWAEIIVDGDHNYVMTAWNILIAHIIMTGVSVLLTALIPVLGKLFGLINTSVDLGENEGMTKIETTDE